MYFAPQEFEGVFHNAIQANNPSVINYMPSSCTGSVQDINENIESSSAEEEEIIVESALDDRCKELCRSFRNLAGLWGTSRFFLNEWDTDDNIAHGTNIDYSSVVEETDTDGYNILTKNIITSGLSRLDACPEFRHYAYTKCLLRKKRLSTIDIMKSYHYLQYVDVSVNFLTTLKPLGNLPFLKYLDASHNCLETVLDFKAPFILTIVNLSYNRIKTIPDLSDFWSITDLNLSHNKITTIEGLSGLRYLNSLNLSSNNITVLKNLDNLHIQFLYLQHNKIQLKCEQEKVFHNLPFLSTLNLNNNEVTSVKSLEGLVSLECLEVANNKIRQLLDIYYLRNLKFLSKLNMMGNPVTWKKRYMEVCITNIEKLLQLDGEKINTEFWNEKLSNELSDVYRRASYKRLKLLILEQMNKPVLWNWLQPYDFEPLNVIVLVGIEGSKRSSTARKLKESCSGVDIAIPYTTRPKHLNEVEGDYYYFVDNTTFLRMLKEGQFLLTEPSLGYSYGYTHAEFKKAENGTLVFYTNLIMALALKNNFLNTKLVLTIPSSTAKLLDNLTTLYGITAVDSATLKVIPSVVVAEECRKQFHQDRSTFIEKEVEHILNDILHHVCLNHYPGFIKDINPNDAGSLATTDTSSHQSLWDDESENNYESDTNEAGMHEKSFAEESKTVTFTLDNNGGSSKEHDQSSIREPEFLRESFLSTMTSDFYLHHNTYKESMLDNTSVNTIYDRVLKQYKELLNIHWSTPGLFRELIFSDYEEETLKKLEMIMQEFKGCNIRKPILDFGRDKSMKAVIEAKVQASFNDLMRETDISAKQKAQFAIKDDRHLCLKNICKNPACPSF